MRSGLSGYGVSVCVCRVHTYLHKHSHEQAHIVLGADLVLFICCGGILGKFSGHGLKSWTGNFSCGQEFSCFHASVLSVIAFHRITPSGSVLRAVCLSVYINFYKLSFFLDVSRLKFLYSNFIVLFPFDLFFPAKFGEEYKLCRSHT